MNKCFKCKTDTKNPRFCSRSCANSWNNKNQPKRQLKKTCKGCPTKIKSERTYCNNCWQLRPRLEKVCKKHGKAKFTYDGTTYRCTNCRTERTTKSRKNTKIKLITLFGKICQCCGYNKSISALHFHHVNKSTKSFGIGSGNTRAWSKILDEVKKCIMVCSNCHCEIHEGLRNITAIPIGPLS